MTVLLSQLFHHSVAILAYYSPPCLVLQLLTINLHNFMLYLLIFAGFLLTLVAGGSLNCSSDEVDNDPQRDLLKLDYVNDRLRHLHQHRFQILWSVDLQAMAEEHRDIIASLDPGIDLDFFVQLRTDMWLLSMSRCPVVIRMIADEYLINKEALIGYLLEHNIMRVGTVGCALYHEGRMGKIFCIYGFSN